MYDSLTCTIKDDEMQPEIKWARFTWGGIIYEVRAALDSEGNVDEVASLQECKDYLELEASWEELV
tara:strand:- start:745 stop:942 length:198 start_codon:yes stop_codon:yes gene_type:complete